MVDSDAVDRLVSAVQAGVKYQNVDPGLVRRIGAAELSKQRGFKDAVKATRSLLHQVGAAYQEGGIDYPRWAGALQNLPPDASAQALTDICRQAMRQHASTRERLPYLDDFYTKILGKVGPIHSVMDLACGLNPLAIPWMSLMEGTLYYACDIYRDLIDFLNAFFAQIGVAGKAFTLDLTQSAPTQPVDLALLLKTIPCLEQLDKSVTPRLLESVQARYMLVSFPAKSLGGRSKGMVENYEAHFHELIRGYDWHVQRFEFPTELAFLVSK